jgi:hypothetical protein
MRSSTLRPPTLASLSVVAGRRAAAALRQQARPLASASGAASDADAKVITKQQSGGLATVMMSCGKTNALSSEMCEELITTVKMLEEDVGVRGFVLGSSVPGIFSSGLSLPELQLPRDGSVDVLANYWTLVQELWLTLYTTPLATIAAVTPHAPSPLGRGPACPHALTPIDLTCDLHGVACVVDL